MIKPLIEKILKEVESKIKLELKNSINVLKQICVWKICSPTSLIESEIKEKMSKSILQRKEEKFTAKVHIISFNINDFGDSTEENVMKESNLEKA